MTCCIACMFRVCLGDGVWYAQYQAPSLCRALVCPMLQRQSSQETIPFFFENHAAQRPVPALPAQRVCTSQVHCAYRPLTDFSPPQRAVTTASCNGFMPPMESHGPSGEPCTVAGAHRACTVTHGQVTEGGACATAMCGRLSWRTAITGGLRVETEERKHARPSCRRRRSQLQRQLAARLRRQRDMFHRTSQHLADRFGYALAVAAIDVGAHAQEGDGR